MRGYKLKQIKREDDLKACGYEWLLDDYPIGDLAGGYIDEDGEVTEFEPANERVSITFLSIVHGRVYPTPCKAIKGKDDNLYIPEDEFEDLF